MKKLGRDLRLDACRGIALWFIFLDHVPNNIGSWLTLRNYGFSDTTEVFMFISGVTCALAYSKAQRRQGWTGAITRTLRRSWDIYAAFLMLILACAVMVYVAGGGQFADESNTRILFEQPGATLAHAMILQYRPVNSDVLPTFVVYHALFAPLLWLLLRAPNAALAASVLLYALVHIFGWTVPAWPKDDWFFNPLAWQVLFVFGAWWATGGGQSLWPLVESRITLVVVSIYLICSFIIAMSWSIKPLEAMIPQALSRLIYPVDKSDLDLLRLLHFLALAVFAARSIPRDWRGLGHNLEQWKPMSPKDHIRSRPQASEPAAARLRWSLITTTMRGAIRCGENSLAIYCLGVLLALGGHMTLANISGGVAMQLAVSLGGVVLMIAIATLLTWIMTNSKQRPGLF
jgi:hypothetical protein